MRKKLIVVGMCLALGASLLAGCSSSKKTSDKGSVYWLNFKPEADQALQDIAKVYKKEKGVDVKVVTAAAGTYDQTLTSEMDKSGAPTLFVVGNQASVKTWSEYCVDLKGTEVYKDLTTDDFTLYDADGKACSIGYCYESYGIIVNKTLLKKAGYEVTDIKDFDSLKKIADDIHKRSKELKFDAFTSSGMDDTSSWRFTGHLANLPLYYEEKADGWKETPAEIKGTYLNLFKNVWDLYITDAAQDPKTLATGGYDAEAEFLDGKAVFYQNGTWEYANLSAKYKDEELAMIPIYCGADGEENAGLCSGTENCWAVNSQASEEDIQATLDFMKWLVSSEEGTKMMAEQFGEIPYKGAAESGNIFLKDAKNLIEAGKYNVDWAFNYTPNGDEWRATLVSAMNEYDNGGSFDVVKAAFVDGWATQYQAANAD